MGTSRQSTTHHGVLSRVRTGKACGALAISLSLLATPVIAAPSPALAEAPARLKPADLPALPSAPAAKAPPPIPEHSLESLDEVAPHPSQLDARNRRPKPSAFDPARSTPVDTETTPTRRIYKNADGSHTAKLHTRPVRYQDGAGAWRDFDLSPVAAPDGTLRAKSAPGAAKLAASSDGAVATVDTAAGPIALSHPGAAPAAAAPDGDEVVYPKTVSGGRDLVLQLTPDGFKETVVLPDLAASPTYLDRFSLPAGISARQGGEGVEFVDSTGAVIAGFGGGFAFDASFPAGGADSTARVSTRLVADPVATEGSASVEVSVDAAWLAKADRAFPVRVDPTFYQNTLAVSGGRDTYVTSGPWANSAFPSSWQVVSGADPNYYVSRTLMYVDLGSLPGPNRIVTSASLGLYNWLSPSCSPRQVSLYGLGAPFSDATTWNNQPPLDAFGPVSSSSFAWGASGCLPYFANFDATSLVRRWVSEGAPNYGMELRAANEADPQALRYYYSSEGDAYATDPTLTVDYNTLPNIATPKSPANGTVFNTATPRLEVNPATDPDGHPVEYFFRITSSPDAEIGAKTEGLASPNTYFDVPAGSLQDGVTYYWHAWTKDPTHWRFPDWVRSFRVDLRLGSGPQPSDAFGPVAVDLSNGNINLRPSSPTLATVAGPLGLSYTYNGQAEGNTGLTGAYYNDPGLTRSFANKSPAMVRRDTDTNFEWGEVGPGGGIGATNFLVSWSGYLVTPTSGNYWVGAGNDDGIRIFVGESTVPVLDRWYDQAFSGAAYDKAVYFTAGVPQRIRVEYYQAAGRAMMTLVAAGPFGPGGAHTSTIVPASWLSAETTAMPKGWSLSAGVGGDGGYRSATTQGSSATLTDASGRTHTYGWADSGFAPPAGERGVLTRSAAGTLSLHEEDGTTYGFDAGGHLSWTTSGPEDGNPAAPVYGWAGSPLRLRTVTDPVSGRQITVRYGSEAGCPTSVPPGFDAAAPPGMVCGASYWDGSATKLFYSSGRLARIEDPGAEISDFAYDAQGKLTKTRDPLGADAVAAGVVPDDDTSRTVVTYASTRWRRSPAPPRATASPARRVPTAARRPPRPPWRWPVWAGCGG